MFVAAVFALGLLLLDVAAFRVNATLGIAVAGLFLAALALSAHRNRPPRP